ncbi:hypothetical protein [Rhodococcus sp. USK10]|uniref:hypothetical protein n=1 Tax=Rhodococcus sp. USK10 TaxID=2789739 RepID=UPI0021507AF9|nr:hypothetical protein [Rhodococcus sp. USK10]
MHSLLSNRGPVYWRRIQREAGDRWLTRGSRGLRGMTRTPPPITDHECATLVAVLVETTGGRWPENQTRIARLLTRLDIDGSAIQMAATIRSLTADPTWPTRAHEIESSAAEWWHQGSS